MASYSFKFKISTTVTKIICWVVKILRQQERHALVGLYPHSISVAGKIDSLFIETSIFIKYELTLNSIEIIYELLPCILSFESYQKSQKYEWLLPISSLTWIWWRKGNKIRVNDYYHLYIFLKKSMHFKDKTKAYNFTWNIRVGYHSLTPFPI